MIKPKGPFTPSASTSVYARLGLRRYGTHAKKRVRSHQARLRPSTDVKTHLV